MELKYHRHFLFLFAQFAWTEVSFVHTTLFALLLMHNLATHNATSWYEFFHFWHEFRSLGSEKNPFSGRKRCVCLYWATENFVHWRHVVRAHLRMSNDPFQQRPWPKQMSLSKGQFFGTSTSSKINLIISEKCVVTTLTNSYFYE